MTGQIFLYLTNKHTASKHPPLTAWNKGVSGQILVQFASNLRLSKYSKIDRALLTRA